VAGPELSELFGQILHEVDTLSHPDWLRHYWGHTPKKRSFVEVSFLAFEKHRYRRLWAWELFSSISRSAERVAQASTDNGGEAIAVGADMSKATDVERVFKEVNSAFGRLDVLVNNAGVFRFGALAEITEQSFHLHSNINVLGAILTAQEASKRFVPDGGSIINLSSIVGRIR
jgi:NAD(P)-dependent dehydrogenase (short-subunit alcohol dehydrogenase family)